MQWWEIEVMIKDNQLGESDSRKIKQEVMLAHTWLRQVRNALNNLDPRLLDKYFDTKEPTLSEFEILKYEANIIRLYIKRFQAGKMSLSRLKRIVDVNLNRANHAALLLNLNITATAVDRKTTQKSKKL